MLRNPDGTFAKNNEGGGRKPRAVEAGMLDKISQYFSGDNEAKLFAAWQYCINHHDMRAIELALAYKAGKPAQTVDLNAAGDMRITVEYKRADDPAS